MTYIFTRKEIKDSFDNGKKAEGFARTLIDVIAPFGALIILWERIQKIFKR